LVLYAIEDVEESAHQLPSFCGKFGSNRALSSIFFNSLFTKNIWFWVQK
jgi:hypothetical protein